jgi:hypothetical protein
VVVVDIFDKTTTIVYSETVNAAAGVPGTPGGGFDVKTGLACPGRKNLDYFMVIATDECAGRWVQQIVQRTNVDD